MGHLLHVGGLSWLMCILYFPWLYPPVDCHEVVLVSCCSRCPRILPTSDWGNRSLDIDDTLGCKVHGKVTITSRYLNTRLHHDHPVKKCLVLSTEAHRSKVICDQKSLQAELDILQTTFWSSRCRSKEVRCTLNPPKQIRPLQHCHVRVAFLPFVQNTFNCIRRLVSKRNIKMVGLPPRKICGCCILSEMTWTLNCQAYVASPVCAAKCVLDKLVAELRPGSRNTIAMSNYQLEESCKGTQLWPQPSACAQQDQHRANKSQHMDWIIKEAMKIDCIPPASIRRMDSA
jgi:hypothetical protein